MKKIFVLTLALAYALCAGAQQKVTLNPDVRYQTMEFFGARGVTTIVIDL